MASVPLPERLAHVFEAIDHIEQLWSGKSFDAYTSDPVLSAATERFLEKICEAVKHIPGEMDIVHKDLGPLRTALIAIRDKAASGAD